MQDFPLIAGQPQWLGWVYGVITAVAAVTDYRSGKIYNWLTLPALMFGASCAFVFGGWHSAVAAFMGAGVAAAIFIPLFVAGVFGGGDVKLMLALGTVLGAGGVFDVACASILIAAAGAVALLVMHGRARAFAREIVKFMRTLLVPGLSVEWPKLNREIKAPFGIAIFFAFVYVLAGGVL